MDTAVNVEAEVLGSSPARGAQWGEPVPGAPAGAVPNDKCEDERDQTECIDNVRGRWALEAPEQPVEGSFWVCQLLVSMAS